MSFKKALSFYFLVLLLLPALPVIAAEKQPEFSATLAIKEGGVTTDAKMHYSKKKQRMEMQDVGMGGGKSVVITRLDKKLIWVLLPSEKAYMESPLSQEKANPLGLDPDTITKKERVGKETVSGHPCVKEKVTVKEADGSIETMYYYQATDLGWAIKAEALDGSWSYTYRDIKAGKQDRALFEVPKGYTRMDMSQIGVPDMTGQPPGLPEPEIPEPDTEPSAPNVPTPL